MEDAMSGVAMSTIPNMNMWNTINNLNMQNMLRNNDDNSTTSTMVVDDTAAMTMMILFFVLFAAGIMFLIFWIMDTEDRRWPIVVAAILILSAFCILIALSV